MPASLRIFLALTLLCLLGTQAVIAGEDDTPTYVIEQGAVRVQKPVTEGIATSSSEGALVVAVQGGTAWARLSFRGVPKDIRAFQHLRLAVAGEDTEDALHVRIRDAKNHVASLRVGTLASKGATRSLALGDFTAEPGFDPTQVASLSMVWFEPSPHRLQVRELSFLPGEDGWRHSDETQARRIFGDRRFKSVKHIETDHFDLWTDAGAAKRSAPKQLETALKRMATLMGVDDATLGELRIPVFVFKSVKEFRAYCQRALGWSKEASARAEATSSYWSIVMRHQGKRTAEITRHVAKVLFQRTRGYGGGAWLLDGIGEYGAQLADKKMPREQIAPRVRSGDIWPMASLLAAERLHGTGKDASYDYRRVYLHAACVVEYLLETPEAFVQSDLPQEDAARIAEGFSRIASVRSTGKKRLEALKPILGPIDEFEAAWKRWASKKKR